MKMLKQIMYDIQKNKKIYIHIEPIGAPAIEIDDEGISDDEFGGMIKTYPTRSKEEMTYEVSDLYEITDNVLSEVTTYISYESQYPPSQIYSILNKNVKYKEFIIDEDSILLGTIPNIVSIL
jgi:hypothetical protein